MLPVVGGMLAARPRSVLRATLTVVASLVPNLSGEAGRRHLVGAVALGDASWL